MCVISPKEVAALSQGSTIQRRTANNVSTFGYNGVFVRCGYIEKVHGAVKIVYESFGAQREAYLGVKEINTFLQDRGAPGQDLVTIRDGIDGTEVLEMAGRAYRSRGGRALLFKTTQSQGELSVPWEAFKKVISGEVVKAHVSRIKPPAKPSPRTTSELSRDLPGRF